MIDRIYYVVWLLIMGMLVGGCGGSKEDISQIQSAEKSQPTEKTARMSTYIYKGNIVDVATFAYKRATNANFKEYAMDVQLPGSAENETAHSSVYEIKTLKVENEIKKIMIRNYQNSLEVKIIDHNRVNILFKDADFTVDRQMSLDDFLKKVGV